MTVPQSPLMRSCLAVVSCLLAGAACDSSNPSAPSPVCAYTLSSQAQSFPSGGGSTPVTISTGADCAWSVQGATGWVALSPAASGAGPGTVTVVVSENTDASPREMTLSIATQPFRVSQEGRTACTYAISPEQREMDDDGGTGQVQVLAAAGCPWTASSHVAWMTITAGTSGQGNGQVRYSVQSNDAASSRTGTLAVAGRTFTLTQEGEGGAPQPLDCQFSVSPVSLAPCMPDGSSTARVTTQPNCRWTASSSASWLAVTSGRSGNGSGTIAFRWSANYDRPRDGAVLVRWNTPTAGQNITVAQAGCLYGVSQATFSVPAGGATASFDVLQQSDPITCGGPTQDRCVWTARSSVSWISIAGTMPRSGDQRVSFTVAANTGGSARTGRISVRDREVSITQAAP